MSSIASVEAAAVGAPNKRGSMRVALSMLRVAKLIVDRREFPCILRDVSAQGVKLRLFTALPGSGRLALDIGKGTSSALISVWERDGHAGFQFAAPIDVESFIAEHRAYPKRGVRLRVCHRAEIAVAGQIHAAVIHDISRAGARVEVATPLAVGQHVRLKATQLPVFGATVRWRREQAYGLAFDEVMSMEELAQRASRMTPPE